MNSVWVWLSMRCDEMMRCGIWDETRWSNLPPQRESCFEMCDEISVLTFVISWTTVSHLISSHLIYCRLISSHLKAAASLVISSQLKAALPLWGGEKKTLHCIISWITVPASHLISSYVICCHLKSSHLKAAASLVISSPSFSVGGERKILHSYD